MPNCHSGSATLMSESSTSSLTQLSKLTCVPFFVTRTACGEKLFWTANSPWSMTFLLSGTSMTLVFVTDDVDACERG